MIASVKCSMCLTRNRKSYQYKSMEVIESHINPKKSLAIPRNRRNSSAVQSRILCGVTIDVLIKRKR